MTRARGDAVSGAAPGEDEDVGVGFGDSFWRGVGSGYADEGSAGSGDELGNPGLGVDEGLAPLFAVDGGLCERCGEGCCCGDGRGDVLDEGFTCWDGIGEGCEEADVIEDGGDVERG